MLDFKFPKMKFIVSLISLFTVIGCNNSKEITGDLKQKLKTVTIKNKKISDKPNFKKDSRPNFDSIKYPKDIKPNLPPTEIIEYSGNQTISCFDPNLKIDDAIKLVNEGTEDTQWFIVDKKEVNCQKKKLDVTDTIFMQNALKKIGWKLIDSVQTTIGNQNKISLKMQNENRICNIEKTLFLSYDTTNNTIQEWFEIRKIK